MNSLCHRYLNQNILPFVGRSGELRQIRNLFRGFLEDGESKYALITGESGSGKSRLVREFEEGLREEFGEACVVVHARYLEGNAAALTPLVNAFTATLTQQEHLKSLLRGLKLLRPSHLETAVLAEAESRSTEPPPLQVLLDSLSVIANRFPLILILEDVHNIEDLPLFDQFFLGLSSAPKFVLLTERTGSAKHFQGQSAEQVMREIALREECTSGVLPLADFGKEDVARLFQILFVVEPSSALVDTVLSRTGGRPLALRSMLRQLVTSGVLLYEHGSWQEDTTATLRESAPEPGDEEELARFQGELQRLNEQEQVVAMHAAMLGEQFDIRLLQKIIDHRLGSDGLSAELFERAIELLTFKSIIRRATPSIVLSLDQPGGPSASYQPSNAKDGSLFCYEFSHQHFWSTVLEGARAAVSGEHDLVLRIVQLAGAEHLPLYSSAFLTVTGTPFTLPKNVGSSSGVSVSKAPPGATMLNSVEYFLHWASAVIRSLWSQEPQQCLRLLVALRPIRDEVTWRFGPELGESAMGSLLELHSLLVEAFLRTGSSVEAERDLEHAAVLEKFTQSSKQYSALFRGITKGKVATLRAILHAGRTSYPEFERWASEARAALADLPESNLDRARLLTLLVRTKGEALLNMGRFKEADALVEHGMPTARLLADSRFDEYSLYYRVAVNSKLKQDQNAQATELTQQIMTQAQHRGNTLVETTFQFQAALASFSTGDLLAATRYCDLGIINGRRYGIRFVETMCYLWRMIIAGVQQDAEKVKECSQQLSMLVEDARVVAQSPNLLQRIALIEGRATAMNFLGRFHAALEFADDAIQLAVRSNHDSFAAWARNEKAFALIGLGRFEEALAVAQACVELAGEQRMAERTARTALIMAYAGVGLFDEARAEADKARIEYNEHNPYFLRFALAEARLMKLSLAASHSKTERHHIRIKLTNAVSDILSFVEHWNAPLLHDQIQAEFQAVMTKKPAIERLPRFSEEGPDGVLVSQSIEPKIRLWTFGPLLASEVTDDSDTTAPPIDSELREARTRDRDSKVRQLISLLLVSRAEAPDSRGGHMAGTLTREYLIDQLWSEGELASAANVLHTTIKRARLLLGNPDSILLNEDGYFLSPIVWSDCEAVIRHYSDSRQSTKRSALFSISFHHEQIIKLTDRGPFLDGVFGPWLDSLRTRLTTLRRTALVRLIQTDIDRGLFDRVEELCHKLLLLDEFDEEATRGLMLVAARRNQKAQLSRVFLDYSSRLKTELKGEPSKEMLGLYESLAGIAESP